MADLAKQTTGHGVVAVIRRENRYLVIRRAEGIRAGGMWCFVGGAVEPGETQRQALVREVREEVGLEVRPLEKVWQCPSLNGEWTLHCWTVEQSDESMTRSTLRDGDDVRPDPREVAAFDWLTPQEILRLPNLIPSVADYFRAQDLLQ